MLGVARIAGIMAAKKTAEIIPLCHPLPLTNCAIDFEMIADAVEATATAALLTIYDMCKAVSKILTSASLD